MFFIQSIDSRSFFILLVLASCKKRFNMCSSGLKLIKIVYDKKCLFFHINNQNVMFPLSKILQNKIHLNGAKNNILLVFNCS